MRDKRDARSVPGDLPDCTARQLCDDHAAAQHRRGWWPAVAAAEVDADVKQFIASHCGVTTCAPADTAPAQACMYRPQRPRWSSVE